MRIRRRWVGCALCRCRTGCWRLGRAVAAVFRPVLCCFLLPWRRAGPRILRSDLVCRRRCSRCWSLPLCLLCLWIGSARSGSRDLLVGFRCFIRLLPLDIPFFHELISMLVRVVCFANIDGIFVTGLTVLCIGFIVITFNTTR